MSLSKDFGHLLSTNTGNRIVTTSKTYVISVSDYAPNSKGLIDISPDQTSGGGPFHIVVKQNGKTIRDSKNVVGGSIACTIGIKFGARPNVTDGDIEFTITGEQHAAHIFSNFDKLA